LARGRYADVFKPGTHFSTFGGNSLQVKAVGAYLDWLLWRGLETVAESASFWRTGLREIFKMETRGRGLCLAVDVESGEDFLAAAMKQKLVMGIFRTGAGAVRITPALNMPTADIERALERLAKAASVC
jgi:acetylornithine/succinyldiaminopimelate/putrescine aminotransferase